MLLVLFNNTRALAGAVLGQGTTGAQLVALRSVAGGAYGKGVCSFVIERSGVLGRKFQVDLCGASLNESKLSRCGFADVDDASRNRKPVDDLHLNGPSIFEIRHFHEGT